MTPILAPLFGLLGAFGPTVSAAAEQTGLVEVRNLAVLMGPGRTINVDRVQQLLEEGADPNARDFHGNTPLHYAAQWPYRPVALRILLAAGAHCEPENRNGQTPLHAAAGHGSPHIGDTVALARVRVLLDCGADPNRPDAGGATPLHAAFAGSSTSGLPATGRADAGIVEALLNAGGDPNARNHREHTPLSLVVGDPHHRTDQPALVRLLLAHGADPETRGPKGTAVLIGALVEDNPGEMSALIEGGADPDVRNPRGDTALILAAQMEKDAWEEIEVLLEGGADPCLTDRERYTAYQHAKRESAGWHLLDRAGGYDWSCDRRAAEAARKRLGDEARSKEQSLGLDGDARQEIQSGLAAEGFDPGPADGVFGAGTRAAIRRWQESRGNAATGYLDDESAEALRIAGQPPGQTPRSGTQAAGADPVVPRCRNAEEKIDQHMNRLLAVISGSGASESAVLCAHVNTLKLLRYLSHECSRDAGLSDADRARERKVASEHESAISVAEARYADMTGGAECDTTETAWTNF